MKTAPVTVTRAITVELLDTNGTSTPLAAELCYETRDPYAVAACFGSGLTNIRWTFARELLAEGLYDPTGDGDVHVWPCLDPRGHAVTIIELSSPDGEALMQARSEDVCDFLRRTEMVVPLGAESQHLDIDSALDKIMGSDAEH